MNHRPNYKSKRIKRLKEYKGEKSLLPQNRQSYLRIGKA